MRLVFMTAAAASTLAVGLICYYLFFNGIPTIMEIGIGDFLFGTRWSPSVDPSFVSYYGIFPMIVGSIYVTVGAILLGVPVGILSAVFMAYFCPSRLYVFLKPVVNLLAGIPSVVYGLFGLKVIVPMIIELTGTNGTSLLAASIVLGIMILPTIIGVAEASIRTVPESFYEASLALGASHERSVFFAVLPACRRGIASAVILGVGRAIGETMAVIMVAGNQPVIPSGLLEGVRTLTANIVIDMGYAQGLHLRALIATGVVLFVFVLIINLCFSMLRRYE